MATASLKFCVFTARRDRLLVAHDGGGRLEGDSEIDGFAVANSTLDATRAVGDGAHFSIDHPERVVVFPAC